MVLDTSEEGLHSFSWYGDVSLKVGVKKDSVHNWSSFPNSNSRRPRLRDIASARKECTLAAIVHTPRKLVGLIGLSPTGVSTAVNEKCKNSPKFGH